MSSLNPRIFWLLRCLPSVTKLCRFNFESYEGSNCKLLGLSAEFLLLLLRGVFIDSALPINGFSSARITDIRFSFFFGEVLLLASMTDASFESSVDTLSWVNSLRIELDC